MSQWVAGLAVRCGFGYQASDKGSEHPQMALFRPVSRRVRPCGYNPGIDENRTNAGLIAASVAGLLVRGVRERLFLVGLPVGH
jgi:hypothetical protein